MPARATGMRSSRVRGALRGWVPDLGTGGPGPSSHMPGRAPMPVNQSHAQQSPCPPVRSPSVVDRLRHGASGSRDGQRGQALLEFAFIIPVMMLVVVGIIEFALAFNATLGVNRASQDAALVASEAGNLPGADCMILRSIESDIGAPSDKREITEVQIQRTNPVRYHRLRQQLLQPLRGDDVHPGRRHHHHGALHRHRDRLSAQPALQHPRRLPVADARTDHGGHHRHPDQLLATLPDAPGAIMDLVSGSARRQPAFAFTQRNAFRMEPQL